MRRLHRPPAPAALAKYQHGRDQWKDIDAVDKMALRSALQACHDGLCSYCEVLLRSWHIEHLWSQHLFPQRTFQWDNLFGCCLTQETCGTHKDRAGLPHNPEDLVDPCREEPDHFLLFVADGSVQPRHGLGNKDLHRARETIRVFNLNSPSLRQRRASVILGLRLAEPDILEVLPTLPEEERPDWVALYLREYAAGPHPTPIRHLLSG